MDQYVKQADKIHDRSLMLNFRQTFARNGYKIKHVILNGINTERLFARFYYGLALILTA